MATSYIPMINGYYTLGTVPLSSSKTFTVANSSRVVLFTIGASPAILNEFIISCGSTGTIVFTNIRDTPNMVISSSGNNKITLTNGTSSINPNVYALVFTGSITVD